MRRMRGGWAGGAHDPKGLRRIVAVELVVGLVNPRPGQRRLKDPVRNPVVGRSGESRLCQQLRLIGATWAAKTASAASSLARRINGCDSSTVRRSIGAWTDAGERPAHRGGRVASTRACPSLQGLQPSYP